MSKKETDISAIELALLRKGTGGIEAVSVGADGQALSNGDIDNIKYRLVLRSPTRSGPKEQSSRARDLKACKGLKGCEFAGCAEKAFGKLPKNLERLKGLCSVNPIRRIN
jgi:hypothetical protein